MTRRPCNPLSPEAVSRAYEVAEVPVSTGAAYEAWLSLAAVKEIETWVQDAVLQVLLHTVADPAAGRPDLPALEIAPPPAAHKPTAARPRAYKGTKDRPPKPRRPAAMDLRPFLCSAAGLDRLRDLLQRELGPCEWPGDGRELEPGLRRFAFASLRGWSAAAQRQIRGLWHQLGLEGDPVLRVGIAHLFSARPGWAEPVCRLLSQAAAGQRGAILAAIWEQPENADGLPVTLSELGEVCAACAEREDAQVPVYALRRLFCGDTDLRGLLRALALLESQELSFPFSSCCPLPTLEDVLQIEDFTVRRLEPPAYLAGSLLVGSSHVPGLAGLVGRIETSRLCAEAQRSFVRVFAYLDETDLGPQRLELIRANFEPLVTALADIDEERRELVYDIFNEWFDEGDTSTIDPLLCLLRVFGRGEELPASYVEKPLAPMTWLLSEQLAAVLGDPQVRQQLIRRARRKNDALLLAEGLNSLVDEVDEWLCSALVADPGRCLQMARELGMLSEETRERLLVEALDQPLFDEGFFGRSAEAVWLDLTAIPEELWRPLVPRQLRRHMDGEIELRSAQLEGHLERLHGAREAIRIEFLRARVQAQMAAGLLPEDLLRSGRISRGLLHALMLHADTDENRRALRRLIRACAAGDHDYLRRHPKNRAWLAGLAADQARRWLDGVVLEGEVEGRGGLRLAFEQDPLEALQLGTHVGSCLGLGGSFIDSAAAVVLDINKQVVFARDARGGFVARQIVALDDRGQLRCYEVYPESGPQLRRLFRDFDLQLAAALGLDGPVDDDAEGEVQLLLASDWWEDGAWDLALKSQSGSSSS